MLLLPNFQRTFGSWTLPDFVFAARFFRSGCKGMSLYNFNQIFLLFFEVFFFVIRARRFEELVAFFEAGCKVTTSYLFNQIFLSDFEDFFFSFTRTFEELFAFFRSGRQRYGEYLYQQIFSFFFFHSLFTLLLFYLLAICKELFQFVNLFFLYFSLLLSLFSRCLFQIGLQR